MPRRCSSGNRSVSRPVRARIRAVLPWSIWPAVPSVSGGPCPSPGTAQAYAAPEGAPASSESAGGAPVNAPRDALDPLAVGIADDETCREPPGHAPARGEPALELDVMNDPLTA